MYQNFHLLTPQVTYLNVDSMPDTKSANDTQDPESLTQAAISAALASEWPQAVKINEKIIAGQKDNVEALNRLARAYICLGETTRAHKTYKKSRRY